MAVNKVVFNGQVQIDLTSDTVTADKILSGYTAHDKAGNKITGTAAAAKPEQSKTVYTNGTVTPDSGKVLSSVVVAIPSYDGSVE